MLLGAIALLLVTRGRRAGRAPIRIGALVRAARWSPYGAGAALGIVVALAALLEGRPIAVSGAVDKLSAYLGRALFADSPYFGHTVRPGVSWHVWMTLGLLLGAFLSAKLSGQVRARWLPDSRWRERFGSSRAKRLGIAFVGAMLVQIGADIAGGCTSGLAISGGALLSPAAFLFMAGMFAGGIPTARLWWWRRDESP